MLARFRDEQGVALVVALLVTFVVMLLGVAVISLAVHNSEQSGFDRKRLQSVSAAEAGLNAAYQHLTAPPGGLAGLQKGLTDSVGSGPGGSTYAVTISYFRKTDGTEPMAPPFSVNYYPGSALLHSVGTSNGRTERTMESFVVLTPVYAGFEGAIVSNSTTTETNSFTVNGYLGDDGHIYVLNGDYHAPSGLETIRGNIYVPNGSAFLCFIGGKVGFGDQPPVGSHELSEFARSLSLIESVLPVLLNPAKGLCEVRLFPEVSLFVRNRVFLDEDLPGGRVFQDPFLDGFKIEQ